MRDAQHRMPDVSLIRLKLEGKLKCVCQFRIQVPIANLHLALHINVLSQITKQFVSLKSH